MFEQQRLLRGLFNIFEVVKHKSIITIAFLASEILQVIEVYIYSVRFKIRIAINSHHGFSIPSSLLRLGHPHIVKGVWTYYKLVAASLSFHVNFYVFCKWKLIDLVLHFYGSTVLADPDLFAVQQGPKSTIVILADFKHAVAVWFLARESVSQVVWSFAVIVLTRHCTGTHC